MERRETLHFSYSPALIKLDVEKVSALSGGLQITSDLTVGVTVGVKQTCAQAHGVLGQPLEPSLGAL